MYPCERIAVNLHIVTWGCLFHGECSLMQTYFEVFNSHRRICEETLADADVDASLLRSLLQVVKSLWDTVGGHSGFSAYLLL